MASRSRHLRHNCKTNAHQSNCSLLSAHKREVFEKDTLARNEIVANALRSNCQLPVAPKERLLETLHADLSQSKCNCGETQTAPMRRQPMSGLPARPYEARHHQTATRKVASMTRYARRQAKHHFVPRTCGSCPHGCNAFAACELLRSRPVSKWAKP